MNNRTHSHSHTLTFTPTGHLERAVSLTPGRGGEPQEHREIEQTPHGSAQNGTLDLVAAPQYKHETSRDVRSNRAADIAEATCGEWRFDAHDGSYALSVCKTKHIIDLRAQSIEPQRKITGSERNCLHLTRALH